MNKKYLNLTIFTLLFVVALPLTAKALAYNTQEIITVAKDEIINDNFFAVGSTVTIDGKINGDVITFANNVTINGVVTGDVIAAANALVINNKVGGNVRAVGSTIKLNGEVARNVTVAGANIILEKNGSVGWSLIAGGDTIEIKGKVFGNLTAAGNVIVINSEIGNQASLNLGERGLLTLKPKAVINGDLIYRGSRDAQINAQAVIKGDTVHKLLPEEILKAQKAFSRSWILLKIISFFSLLLVGTLIISLSKEKTQTVAQAMWHAPGIKMLWGALLVFATPLIIIVLIFTIIGAPLALIITALYFFFIYITKVFVGIAIGQKIIRRNKAQKETSLIWVMMLGVFIYYIIINVPFVGWIISLLGISWFLGTIWEMIMPKKDKHSINQNAKP